MNWKQKLTSRKLWACLIGVGVGLGLAFGLDEGTISTCAGAITSLASIITYVVTEGRIDAKAVNQAYIDIGTLIDQVKDALTEDKIGGSI